MGVLSNLEPQKVFHFFEEITKIPHGSGNVGQISDFLAEFARERNLYCVQDAVKNIIIVKEAAPGYEKEPAVILQGHMDMVAVKSMRRGPAWAAMTELRWRMRWPFWIPTQSVIRVWRW